MDDEGLAAQQPGAAMMGSHSPPDPAPAPAQLTTTRKDEVQEEGMKQCPRERRPQETATLSV